MTLVKSAANLHPCGITSLIEDLAELHAGGFALALLKLFVQEGARLLVSPVDLKALKEHLLVVGAGTLQLLLLL